MLICFYSFAKKLAKESILARRLKGKRFDRGGPSGSVFVSVFNRCTQDDCWVVLRFSICCIDGCEFFWLKVRKKPCFANYCLQNKAFY